MNFFCFYSDFHNVWVNRQQLEFHICSYAQSFATHQLGWSTWKEGSCLTDMLLENQSTFFFCSIYREFWMILNTTTIVDMGSTCGTEFLPMNFWYTVTNKALPIEWRATIFDIYMLNNNHFECIGSFNYADLPNVSCFIIHIKILHLLI